MIRRATCPDSDALVSFLFDEFDGSEAADRRTIARHLEECGRCAAEVASLGGVREKLREWEAPEPVLGFRVVQEPPRRFAWLPAWSVPALPLAAAAVLVLAAGLGVARLDIQYDANGLRVRTGWGHAAPTAAAANASIGPASASVSPTATTVPLVAAPTASTRYTGPGSTPAPNDAASWRAELTALEQRMRQEFAAVRRAGGDRVMATNVAAGDENLPAATPAEQALLRRLQTLIDQSEVRQQQNLALRVAEISRDFDLARRSDLVRIEQGFARFANPRAEDVEQQRQILNAIRVSQPQP
jgi:hypothetical protein